MRISDNFDMDIESEKKNNNRLKKLMVSTGCILLIISIVIGPVYTKLDLNGEPVGAWVYF